jgi:hypothetical protein
VIACAICSMIAEVPRLLVGGAGMETASIVTNAVFASATHLTIR